MFKSGAEVISAHLVQLSDFPTIQKIWINGSDPTEAHQLLTDVSHTAAASEIVI